MFATGLTLLLLLLLAHQREALIISSKLLTPPPGNSLAIRALALDGKLTYVCEKDGGEWVLAQKRASLMDQTNHTKLIGYYTRNYAIPFSSRHMGEWTLINSEGDEAESGHLTSVVYGKMLVTKGRGQNKLRNFLAQATLHRYEGAARRVSYIAEINTKTLARPSMSKCKANNNTMTVGYTSEYAFWTQDVLPPKVPKSLLVPSKHHNVEAFFAQGNVRFTYDHKMGSWRQRRVIARLHDVPGGVRLGGFSYNISLPTVAKSLSEKNSNDLACINIDNPNGFEVCGILESMASSSAHQDSLSWSLFRVTSNNGFITKIWGPFTYFHMVSTWGGLPPPASYGPSVATTSKGWKSYFTCIFWLYTSKEA
ncbi:hypothetical protein GOP47_0013758 [Adiantum capillus-veneris]|nr:hypothetical protein GOP47_0013758 [Adiantum capillus-veneris]